MEQITNEETTFPEPLPLKEEDEAAPSPTPRVVSLSGGKSKELQGFLFKQGPRENLMKRRWKKRWFRQRGYTLSYYRNAETDVERGKIDFRRGIFD